MEFDGKNASLHAEAPHRVEVNGVKRSIARLRSDQEKVPSYVELENLRPVVIQRPSGTGMRMWDNTRPDRHTHPPLNWYPVLEQYLVAASYSRFPTARIYQMPDILGSLRDEKMDGEVKFELEGKNHQLLVSEQVDGRLFIQFSDLTSGKTTSPPGRHHYTELPKNGRVFVDFNKAYNPPCVFTEFATCTFAPQENHLKISIQAGATFSGHL